MLLLDYAFSRWIAKRLVYYTTEVKAAKQPNAKKERSNMGKHCSGERQATNTPFVLRL
jgi:hypothetical protein